MDNMKMILPFVEKTFSFNENDFLKAMHEADQELIREGIEPNRRTLFVLSKLQKTLPELLTVPILMSSYCNDFNGKYSNLNLFNQISKWYTLRYGDKLNMGYLAIIGEMILLIDNEPFKTIFPVILGTVGINWNILSKRIEGLTPFRANQLDSIAIYNLLEIYSRTFEAFLRYDELGLCYHKEAINDLHKAIDGIINSDGYGQSKWDTLQFTEKVLKGVIIHVTKQRAENTHDLKKLAKLLPKEINIDVKYLNRINDRPGLRYGEKNITRNEAIKAHIASMKIFRDVMKAFSKDKNALKNKDHV